MLVLKGVRNIETLHCVKRTNLRFFSAETAAQKKDEAVTVRKYLKPLSTPELKPWPGNFFGNLFAGSLDKRIFEYPAVLRDKTIDVVLRHTSEVEAFIRDNPECLLTKDKLQELRKLELFGLSVPHKYEGAGYNNTETNFLLECTGVNPKLGQFLSYNEQFGCKLLNQYGSEKQKLKYLSRLAKGENFISPAYLENVPLIDLSKFEGFAFYNEEKNHYVLNAEKKWVHNADISDLFLVMVKTATVCDSNTIAMKFKMFLIEKNTPGVTVHRVLSQNDLETNNFDVTFEDVCLGQENVLGSENINGFDILKSGLTHSHVTDATLCLSVMKEIIYYVLQYIENKSLGDFSVKGHGLIQENLASISQYIYALESAVYLITGRFDLYENPDLFHESILVKALAVEFLQKCIQKYIEILGREGLIKSRILDKAVKLWQHYIVFEENIENLKLTAASEGLVYAAPFLRKDVMSLRRPYDNYKTVLKELFKGELKNIIKPKPIHNFKMELHDSLSEAADSLDESFRNFECVLKGLFLQEGSLALNSEHVVIKLAEMAAYLYAAVACLSRVNTSICYDFENFESDSLLATSFVFYTEFRNRQLIFEECEFEKLQEFYRIIGKMAFNNKSYPAEHPLSRTY